MRSRLASAWLWGACACACGAEEGLSLEVSSEVSPLDRLDVTVLGPSEALVVDEPILGGDAGDPLELPGTIRLEVGGVEARVRVLVWGWEADQRVAFGAVEIDVSPGLDDRVPLRLEPPPPDEDGDAIPDPEDGCPDLPDPRQQDHDADGATDACECPDNLVANASFEVDGAGFDASEWWAGDSTLGEARPGHGGTAFAARICKADSGGPGAYELSDSPDTVTDPRPGESYRFTAQVRADDDASGPQTLVGVAHLFEDQVPTEGFFGARIESSGQWQRLATTIEVEAAGPGASLGVRVRSEAAADGACFEVDQVCLRLLP